MRKLIKYFLKQVQGEGERKYLLFPFCTFLLLEVSLALSPSSRVQGAKVLTVLTNLVLKNQLLSGVNCFKRDLVFWKPYRIT